MTNVTTNICAETLDGGSLLGGVDVTGGSLLLGVLGDVVGISLLIATDDSPLTLLGSLSSLMLIVVASVVILVLGSLVVTERWSEVDGVGRQPARSAIVTRIIICFS